MGFGGLLGGWWFIGGLVVHWGVGGLLGGWWFIGGLVVYWGVGGLLGVWEILMVFMGVGKVSFWDNVVLKLP